MKRVCLYVVLALLAGFSLHGQTANFIVVQDVLGGTSFAPGSLAYVYTSFYVGTSPSVTVGGENGYIIASGDVSQLEIQIPVNAPVGASIPVECEGYQASAALPITISQYAPILMPQAAGASTVSAWHSDGTPVSPAAPAMPSETINLYAVGLGPTTPVIPTGGSGNARTTTIPTVTLAGSQCTVLHAELGLAGIGTYQVYFTMPANPPSGNQNVSVSIGGATSNTLTIAVGPNPAITGVLNNYSYVLPGAANYGIAPGSIFVIFGTGMATPGAPAVLQDSSKGLPLTLNGASVAVTVAGVTLQPALYYATPTQIAAVLPSNMPLGAGTVTVTYDEMTSTSAAIQVVQSALGLATMSGDGTGQAMATDANYNFISPTSSAAAGQIITLWGSGLGADTAVSDTTYSGPHQITNIPLTIYLGGAPATVEWAGRSGYPGLDQIDVQMPVLAKATAIPVGCSAPLTAVGGAVGSGLASNAVTLPATIAGGACMQPPFVLDPSVAQTFSGNDAVIFGFLSVSQNGSQTMAGGSFETIPGSVLATFAGNRTASAGSCIAVPPADTYTSTYLFEGASIVLLGTAGQQQLPVDVTGDYGGQLPASWAPSAGEAFTFTGSSRSAAGTWVFSTAANFPAQLDWTNQQSIGAIHRSQGIQLTWTGGDADGVVAIRGSSFAAAGAPAPSGSFLCSVPASAGQFTVPASVLNALPAGAGTLTVENESAPQTIAASGLDIGYAFAGALFTINAAYD